MTDGQRMTKGELDQMIRQIQNSRAELRGADMYRLRLQIDEWLSETPSIKMTYVIQEMEL